MQTRRRRIPERQRYINRARYLKDNRSFQRACADAAADWNELFPDFPVRRERVPPDALAYQAHAFVLPPALEKIRSLSKVSHQLSVDRRISIKSDHPDEAKRAHEAKRPLIIADPYATDATTVGKRTLSAKQIWRGRILALCDRFFLPLDFPDWLNCPCHPAHHFVAACVIWNPQFVREEWIVHGQTPVISIPFSPHDPTSVDHLPEVSALRAENDILQMLLDRYVPSEDERRKIRASAHAAGTAAFQSAAANLHHRPAAVLDIGITGQDIKDRAQEMAEAVNAQDDLKRRVAAAFVDGEGVASIARRIGVDYKTVSNWLSEETPDATSELEDDYSDGNTG